MQNTLRRDEMGRILGTINEFYSDENDSYFDQKCHDVRFPEYRQNFNSEVRTYSIKELKNENK